MRRPADLVPDASPSDACVRFCCSYLGVARAYCILILVLVGAVLIVFVLGASYASLWHLKPELRARFRTNCTTLLVMLLYLTYVPLTHYISSALACQKARGAAAAPARQQRSAARRRVSPLWPLLPLTAFALA